MDTLLTIGFTRKSLARFIGLLREGEVDAVIDVRRQNTSQLAGFAKRDDLAFLLREGFAIDYEHLPELAPPAELLAAYHRDGDWERYAAAFEALMTADEMTRRAAPVLERYRRPCLLCAEEQPDQCHRRLLAERLREERPGLTIIHLG